MQFVVPHRPGFVVVQGKNLCKHGRPRQAQTIVAPFVPNVIDVKGQALMESLSSMQRHVHGLENRTTLLHFKGRCSHHSQNPGAQLRSRVAAAMADEPDDVNVRPSVTRPAPLPPAWSLQEVEVENSELHSNMQAGFPASAGKVRRRVEIGPRRHNVQQKIQHLPSSEHMIFGTTNPLRMCQKLVIVWHLLLGSMLYLCMVEGVWDLHRADRAALFELCCSKCDPCHDLVSR